MIKIILAYIYMMVPTPSEEWELQQLPSHDKHYLIVHKSGKWYEKVVDKQNRPIYISNSDSYRYLISWEQGKTKIKYKVPNSWKWAKLN
jgi:hypothetical protein